MSKVIIGIHGRKNKAEESVLEGYWKKAINEGLKYNCGVELSDAVSFEMAYYADINFPVPSDDFPYEKAQKGDIKEYQQTRIDRIREISSPFMDIGLDNLQNLYLEHPWIRRFREGVFSWVMKDLVDYYRSNNSNKASVQKPLKELISKYRDHEIFLVSHSMGSIVAYDVLRLIGRLTEGEPYYSALKDVKVEHFVTLGSPLGLPLVKGYNLKNHNDLVRTPSCVKEGWKNYADPQDLVCLDMHLRDDYGSNSSGVLVEDILVANDVKGDSHSSFGYLRTPEFSRYLCSFI